MGVLEFFGTLIKNDITSSSIQSDFSQKMPINHFMLDFNSIVHVSSQKILSDVNGFLKAVLKNIFHGKAVNQVLSENFDRYKMSDVQKKIKPDTRPEDVVKLFHKHFDDSRMDKLIITLVINNLLSLIKTFCRNSDIKTLMIAIDGVPSKGKLIEQRQRRYLGAITEAYRNRLLHKYRDYLKDLPDNTYLSTKYAIKWSRNKITPGTAFMHKLSRYLSSDAITQKLKFNRSKMKIVFSDMYEVGEGEKKIVNYVNKYLSNTNDTIMIYSPDADVILLCMLLPVDKLYMLRHNQQSSPRAGRNVYDLINILSLKSNISFYVNNHPDYSQENFEINRINRDIVCMSTLFGNDFVPKMETLNIKKGFQNILDAYLKTLIKLKSKSGYLIKTPDSDGQSQLSFTFLKQVLRYLLPEENDFIKNNVLYGQYVTIGQIKTVFDYMEINEENLVETYHAFRVEYDKFKHAIRSGAALGYYETHDQLMTSIKKAINVTVDGQVVNTIHLSNIELIKVLREYYKRNGDFPRLNINLNTWSHSITDYKHKQVVKEKKFNDFQKEEYKFMQMLDEYYIKFNAQPLDLTASKIPEYYKKYFNVKITDSKGALTAYANQVMGDYLEGLLWVFNYYFNDTGYVNTWYYPHERSPLIRDFLKYLDGITPADFKKIYDGLSAYQVTKLSSYFNPIEQLIYVSPMTNDIVKLLPSNYQEYIKSDKLDPFLKTYFIDIDEATDKIWSEKVCKGVDCRGIIYFNKCLLSILDRPTTSNDKTYLKAIRKIKPNDASKRRSQSKMPDY